MKMAKRLQLYIEYSRHTSATATLPHRGAELNWKNAFTNTIFCDSTAFFVTRGTVGKL